jgi:hypothetical protein
MGRVNPCRLMTDLHLQCLYFEHGRLGYTVPIADVVPKPHSENRNPMYFEVISRTSGT